MKNLIANKITKGSAYLFGVALLFFGMVGLVNQFELGSTSHDSFSSYLLAVVFIISGAFTCIATRMKFRGGILTVLGFNFIGFGFIGIASIVESRLQDSNWIFSRAFYFRVIAFCIIGFVCLVLGLMRTQKNDRKETETT